MCVCVCVCVCLLCVSEVKLGNYMFPAGRCSLLMLNHTLFLHDIYWGRPFKQKRFFVRRRRWHRERELIDISAAHDADVGEKQGLRNAHGEKLAERR